MLATTSATTFSLSETSLKIILIYVKGCEKRNPKQVYTDMCEIKSEKLIFTNLDR